MGRQSRRKNSKQFKGVYKLLRESTPTTDGYMDESVFVFSGKTYKMALNPLKKMMLGKPYEHDGAKMVANELYKKIDYLTKRAIEDTKTQKL